MPPQFAHLSKENVAEIYEAAGDLYELIGADQAFPQELRTQLLTLLFLAEETLTLVDPLPAIDYEPEFVTVLEVVR